MMHSSFKLILLFSLTFIAKFAIGQLTTTEYIKLAEDQINGGNLKAAEKYFEEAIALNKSTTILLLKYGDCLSLLLKSKESNEIYRQILSSQDSLKYWYLHLNIARNQISNGDYELAKLTLEKYKKGQDYVNESNTNKKEADKLFKSCEFAAIHANDSTQFLIIHLGTEINTNQSEFNPVNFNDKYLVWSYYRAVYSDTLQLYFGQEYRSEIFHADENNNIYKNLGSFGKTLNSKKWFTANICFSSDYTISYFTRCENLNGNIGDCQIWTSKLKSGIWTRPQPLPGEINLPNTNNTHPNIASVDDYQILYFSSNRKGGQGGQDIWYSIFKDGEFSTPSNIGFPVNTIGDELTPFYDSENKILYFSSDNHENFGGLDIFKSHGNLNTFSKPENLGLPANSEFNDLYFNFNKSTGEGYLSSNRSITLNSGIETHCCYDIYKVFENTKQNRQKLTDTIKQITNSEEKIIKLLPLTLYFDNDQPDPRSLNDSTTTTYNKLLTDYLLQKPTYITEYSFGLKGKDKEQAVDTISSFFDSQVEKGFDDLNMFCELLETELESGKRVKIEIKGYASPLNNPEYNLALSKRRIASLENYLRYYKGGYFDIYFEKRDSVSPYLTLVKLPFGDSESRKYVSDNPNDKRNSVYSKTAAMERKIQIVLYSSTSSGIKSSTIETLKFSSDTINVGSMLQNQFKSGRLTVTNTGNKSIEINKITTSCMCLQVEFSPQVIEPNQTLPIIYLLKSDLAGADSKKASLRIETGDGSSREVIFQFEIH